MREECRPRTTASPLSRGGVASKISNQRSHRDRNQECGVMKVCIRGILIFLAACLLPRSVRAQNLGQVGVGNSVYGLEQAIWVVAGKVKTAQGVPVRGATV